MGGQTGDGRHCVSCHGVEPTVQLHSVAPGVAICRPCVGDGFAKGVFCDLIYTIRWRLRRSVEALKRTIVHENDRVGWDRFLKQSAIGVSSTAYAVGLLKQLDPSLPELPAAVDTVRSAYMVDGEREHSGGWPITSIPGVILTEPTCYCAGQLIGAGFVNYDSSEVVGAVHWLLGEQHSDGGWSPQRELPVDCYATALVVGSLGRWRNGFSGSVAAPVGTAIEKGIRWLANAVNRDGGWGWRCGDASDPWHTAHSLRAIVAVGGVEDYDRGAKAIDYLLGRRKDWEQIIPVSYNVKTNSGDRRANYLYHPMPIVVHALLSAGVSPQHPAVVTAILDMAEGQDPKTGTWKYPVGTDGTIFELCHNAECLREFIERANWVGALVDLQRQMGELAGKVGRIETRGDEVAGSTVVGRQWDTGIVGSLVVGLLVYTGTDRFVPTISDRALLAGAGTGTVVAWVMHRLRISRNRRERVGYLAILGMVFLVVYGVVEPQPGVWHNNLSTILGTILGGLGLKLLGDGRR